MLYVFFFFFSEGRLPFTNPFFLDPFFNQQYLHERTNKEKVDQPAKASNTRGGHSVRSSDALLVPTEDDSTGDGSEIRRSPPGMQKTL